VQPNLGEAKATMKMVIANGRIACKAPMRGHSTSAAVQPAFPCRPHTAFMQSGSRALTMQEDINPAIAYNLAQSIVAAAPYRSSCAVPQGYKTTDSRISPRVRVMRLRLIGQAFVFDFLASQAASR